MEENLSFYRRRSPIPDSGGSEHQSDGGDHLMEENLSFYKLRYLMKENLSFYRLRSPIPDRGESEFL